MVIKQAAARTENENAVVVEQRRARSAPLGQLHAHDGLHLSGWASGVIDARDRL
jgi:acyl dehydratase